MHLILYSLHLAVLVSNSEYVLYEVWLFLWVVDGFWMIISCGEWSYCWPNIEFIVLS